MRNVLNSWVLFFSVFLILSSAQALPKGWIEIKTGGETLCARGAEYAFFVRKGDPQKILIDFSGGGACWDGFTCDNRQVFKDDIRDARSKVTAQNGVYDHQDSRNPYKDWTHVVVPYCTGDLHLGSGDAVYQRFGKEPFTIHHRGAINAQAVMNWVQSQYQVVNEISVAGCSAGSYASVLWTAYIAEKYKAARILQYGDSGAGVSDRMFFPQWEMGAVIPNWIPSLNPVFVDWNKLNIVEVYKGIAEYYPMIQFSQFNHAGDRIQKFFYALMGGDTGSWLPRMFSNMEETSALPNFHYFVASGPNHCAFSKPLLYSTTTEGRDLHNWLSNAVLGRGFENVKCAACLTEVE